jgi:L-ectoine synthase
VIVKSLEDLRSEGQEVVSDGWTSRRYLLKKDGMGFSFHETIIKEGAELNMWYKNHLESVYCVSGKGRILDKAENKWHDIYPGVIYALNLNDRHTLVCEEELRFLCVFNPPCVGPEKHDADGAYPLLD